MPKTAGCRSSEGSGSFRHTTGVGTQVGSTRDTLTRLALSEAATEPGLAAKASAFIRLADAGENSPVPAGRLRAELQAVVETEALSARGLAGVLQAIWRLSSGLICRYWPVPHDSFVGIVSRAGGTPRGAHNRIGGTSHGEG